MKRRDFLSGVAITSASLAVAQTTKVAAEQPQAKAPVRAGGKTVMICAANGIPLNPDGTPRANHLDAGYKQLAAGADTLDAAITRGALGLRRVLTALERQEVQTLIVGRGFHAEAAEVP